MTWYLWLLVVLGLVIAASAAAILALRASANGRDFLSLGVRQKLRFGRYLLASPLTPWPLKAILGLLVVYLLSPIDIVPDFIPVLGQADDLAVMAIIAAVVLYLLPRPQVEAALLAARGDGAPTEPPAVR